MVTRTIIAAAALAAAAFGSAVTLTSAQAPATPGQAQVSFSRDILPVMEASCLSCHGADNQLGGLDLRTREAAIRGGDHGAALVPGNAGQSKLFRMISGAEQPAMPMGVDPLTPAQIAAFRSWIDRGAEWEVPVTFARDIQPIMERSCWTCHGASVQLSKLDLRTREGALRGGAHGPALVPGKSDESRMFRAIAHLDAIKMPMQGEKLKPEEISAFKAWIDQGAKWEATAPSAAASSGSSALAALERMDLTPEQRNYWAFKLPVQAPPPVVANKDLAHPIDRFLEKERVARNLVAAPRADRLTLVRRAYLDLLGLPPSPAEVAAFVEDNSPQAWEKLVDKLLASPHYGERYGRHWLDVARYADSAGFEYDVHRANAWRYRDYVIKSFNEDKPYNLFITEQLAGDEMDYRTHETLIATGFLRAGPRVLFREKDNPERRFDYLDEILGTIGKGMLGVTVNCARCHNHKFDPISQKDYYSMQAAIFGYVETEVPLAPRAEAEAYILKNEEIDARLEKLRKDVADIDKPHREKLELDEIRTRFPEHIYKAAAKPDSERTPGERLLATQVYEAVNVAPAQIDKLLSPDEAARKKVLNEQIAAVDKERPRPLPMIEVATDGDHRFSPLGEGDNVVSCPKCRIPPPFPGSYVHRDGKYETPPSYFLIRGDAESHGSQMKPGFIQIAVHGEHATEIPRPDGNTSGRRLALARWIASPQNPLTSRVIVNRLWQKHFGRGIVATLENFGKMGEQPTNQELLDWMAVEFMNRGWSIKQINKLMMMSEAYQMASAYDNPSNLKADLENRYLWRYRPQRLEAEIVRDSMLAIGGNINLAVGGEPIFPFIAADILVGQYRGKWENTPEGPAAWRRGVYVYRRRSLPYPMFDTFDHPDMNVTSGARNVSTVPTQALTLLNNPFVLGQAKWLADRVRQEASDPYTQINLAYRLALARPATETEVSVGLDLIEKHSLESFTHVVLNLDEFMYMR
jgi:cytochrome c553